MASTQVPTVIDNLLVRIHFIIEMIWWTGLAPYDDVIEIGDHPDGFHSGSAEFANASHTLNPEP